MAYTKHALLFAVSFMFAGLSYGQGQLLSLPSATVHTLQGKSVNTSTFQNGGKPIIVSFWATWCAPCKRELNAIAELYDDWQAETGVKLIAVSIDDSRSQTRVLPFVNGASWDYEVYIDTNQDFKRAMGVNNVPHTFLLDGNRQVVWQHNSYADGDELELYRKVLEHIR